VTLSDLAYSDPQGFLEGLVDGVGRALPGSRAAQVLTVERERSIKDRLAGRSGSIAILTLSVPAEILTLTYRPGPVWDSQSARLSSGVIVARRSLDLGEWLTAFAGRIATLSADAAGDAAAAARALESLGVQAAGADIHVGETQIATDLRILRNLVRGRIPDDAAQRVDRIGDVLAETVALVANDPEAEQVVRRTATIYLPDTLRAFLALPHEWVVGHVFPDGTTPTDAFIAQLAAIEDAVGHMRIAAIEHHAAELLANGRFLAEKFGRSSLEL
jgi:hypothetical protein